VINGNIENGLHPKIEIMMRVGNASAALTVLVDSGFDGELALHFDHFDQFQLELVDVARVQYGDGRIVEEMLCHGQIEWSGVVRPVEIILSGDEEPAIGMGLLRNTRVLLV
jgi:predicted aspartyl protease